jgi:hypothetical protein
MASDKAFILKVVNNKFTHILDAATNLRESRLFLFLRKFCGLSVGSQALHGSQLLNIGVALLPHSLDGRGMV